MNGNNTSWVHVLLDLGKPSKSLDTSLFAFCLVQLHVTRTGNPSLPLCLDQYNLALQHLRSDLENPEKRFNQETLAAISVLSTCELFVCPNGSGWSVHAGGILEILRLHDPRSKTTTAWRHLFSRLRIICTLEALTKRQARFLDHEIWRPAIGEDESRNAVSQVIDKLEDIATLLERSLGLPSISDDQRFLAEASTLTRSLLEIVEVFNRFHITYSHASATPRYWSVPSLAVNPADHDIPNKIFPTMFEFQSLQVAVPIVQTWAMSVQLYSNIIQIYDLVQARLGKKIELEELVAGDALGAAPEAESIEQARQSVTLSPSRPKYTIHDIREAGTRTARNICQSMEYYHRTDMGTYGAHATIHPSWSARQYFRLHPGHERELSWLQSMHEMKGPGTRWGITMMKFADIAEPLRGWS